MKADAKVVADLLSACGTLATMAEQFRIDRRLLKAADIDYVAHIAKAWYKGAEGHLDILLKRLAAYNGDCGYTVGKLQGSGGDVPGLLQRAGALLQSAFDQFVQFRTRAMQIRNDGTPDDYEHAIQFLEEALWCCEQQMNLVGGLGAQGYIGARLEDE